MFQADHFAFQVSDLDQAIQFYTEAFGLRLLLRELDQEHHEAYAFLELDGGNLELLQLLDENNDPLPFAKPEVVEPYCPHLALKTEDMDELVAVARQKNIPVVKGPMEISGEVRWIYMRDPDHNVIEFIQWL